MWDRGLRTTKQGGSLLHKDDDKRVISLCCFFWFFCDVYFGVMFAHKGGQVMEVRKFSCELEGEISLKSRGKQTSKPVSQRLQGRRC